MFGFPAYTMLAWANVISLSGLAIAAAGAIMAYQLSARMNAAHSLEVEQAQTAARNQIEVAVAQANARIADLVRAQEDLQLALHTEKEARNEISVRSQARDLTSEQMAKFVGAIRGQVRQINLFTVPDRGGSIFGLMILDALREADVSVTWYRMPSLPSFGQGIDNSGVTIYEYAAGERDQSVGRTLAKAFTVIDVRPNLLVPAQPLSYLPSPSLIIAPRPPEFLRPSQAPIRPSPSSTIPANLLSY